MSVTYALISPARNEEDYIEQTILSVINQSTRPLVWVIVSDGSTDRTDEIVEKYVAEHDFIKLVKAEKEKNRNFGSKVNAFKAGYRLIEDMQFDFIGNLDADVSFEPDYFENILQEFSREPRLGLAGGIICELVNGKYVRQNISLNSVAGAVQLYRRECFDKIGGLLPLKLGGEDSAAEIMVRMNGRIVQTFPQYEVMHHRRVGTGGNRVFFRSVFQKGLVNYSLGYHPLFHLAISINKCRFKPYFVNGILLLSGYVWGMIGNYERLVPDDVVKFLRNEQLQRLKLRR